MTPDEIQSSLQGKTFLIGLTFLDPDENLIEQRQTSGIFSHLTNEDLMVFTKANGSLFYLPYDEHSIKPLAAGEYREKSTGIVIVDPDYLTTWTIIVNTPKDLGEIKEHGFIP